MMALNNLLASPSFESWRVGEPLDVDRMLRAPDGRARLSIVSTAHLADEERLFVTALLLDKVKTWMRRQGGTTELRALVYMDEIFGYFPPHPANPPTKRPLLTLLKQARAQGVGVVLATQNPVDLDYKGLANMGTWMVGTLQTQQDRERLSGGLQGAGLEPKAVEKLLAGTKKRVFLLHDVHRPAAVPPPVALGDVVPARPAHAGGDLAAHEGEARRRGRARRAEGGVGPGRPARAASALPPPLPVEARRRRRDAAPAGEVRRALQGSRTRRSACARGRSAGATPADTLESEPIEVDEASVAADAPAGLRYLDLPAWLASAGAKGIEKALRERLDDQLDRHRLPRPRHEVGVEAGRDPRGVRGADRRRRGALRTSCARSSRRSGPTSRCASRRSPAASRRSGSPSASAVLSNIGLLTGRKRSVSGVGSVLSKNRMEGTAEARLEALRADVAELERQLAETTAVDPARLVEETLAPVRGGVGLLRYDLIWVH